MRVIVIKIDKSVTDLMPASRYVELLISTILLLSGTLRNGTVPAIASSIALCLFDSLIRYDYIAMIKNLPAIRNLACYCFINH